MPLARGGRPVPAPGQLLERGADGVDRVEELAGPVGHLAFRQVAVLQHHDVLQLALALPEGLAEMQHVPRDDQAARQRDHDPLLAALDPLRDGHLAFPREQRHPTHLSEIRAHQVLALIGFVTGRVHLRLGYHAQRRAPGGVDLDLIGGPLDLDALALELLQHRGKLFGLDVGREMLDDLVNGHEAPFLTCGNQIPHQVLSVLRQQWLLSTCAEVVPKAALNVWWDSGSPAVPL